MDARPPLLLVALLAAGCGGGGGARTVSGALVVHTVWPHAGRVIPTAAQSVAIQVLQGATVVNQTIVTPGTPTATFADVPVGTMTVKATAYPTAGGTGTAMASAQTTQAVTSGGSANVSLTMASTIDHLTLSPSPVALSLSGIFSRQLTVTAYDVSNNVVLTSPSDIHYSVSNGLLLSVSATGLVQGLAVGVSAVTATDSISGKTSNATVNISL